jgi:hypothetical protein
LQLEISSHISSSSSSEKNSEMAPEGTQLLSLLDNSADDVQSGSYQSVFLSNAVIPAPELYTNVQSTLKYLAVCAGDNAKKLIGAWSLGKPAYAA